MTHGSRSTPIAALVIAAVVAAITAVVTVQFVAPAESDTRDLLHRVQRLEAAADAAPTTGARGDRTLLRRIEALETRAQDSVSSPAAATAPQAKPAAAAASVDAETVRVRDELGVGLASQPGSSAHADTVDRLAAHLIASAGPPRRETELAWATRALLRESYRDRISPEEAARIEPVLLALPAGHAARPPLAQAVAIGWSTDARMSGFLSQFATNSEPAVHQGILAILDDEHPGPAFSEYVIRIVREEREPAVLGIALGLDRIEAAATAAVAPRLVEVIESRIDRGDLDADMRTRAGLAIAVASLRAPDLGETVLRRLAAKESDAELQILLRSSAEQLATGNATLKSLERLFD